MAMEIAMSRKDLLVAISLSFSACTEQCACHSTPAAQEPAVSHPPRPSASASAPASGERTLTVDEVEQRIWRPGPPARFTATTVAEREALARLIPAMARGASAASPPDPAGWAEAAAAADLRIEVWRVGGERYWALLEPLERRRGAGAYVFRVAPADPAAPAILLEAPHAYYDVGTDRIAARLFFDTGDAGVARPRALFTNTIHRYITESGTKVKRPDSAADVTHNPEHGFNTATVAFAETVPGTRVIQLHGFAAADEGAVSETMVVSAGDEAGSSPRSRAVAAGLVRLFGTGVKRFPEETRRLGATTNVQGRALRRVAGASFVHIEMSPETRSLLKSDGERRRALARVLFAAGGETP
jgi:hypothetical protein